MVKLFESSIYNICKSTTITHNRIINEARTTALWYLSIYSVFLFIYSGFIFINALKFYPYEILIGQVGNKGLFLTSAQMLSFTGLFPYYYENQYFYSHTFNILFIKFFNYLFVIIATISVFLIFKSSTKVFMKKNKKIDIFYLFINLFLIIHVLFTSLVTCCENPRIMIMFFFIIASVIFLNFKFIFFKNNN